MPFAGSTCAPETRKEVCLILNPIFILILEMLEQESRGFFEKLRFAREAPLPTGLTFDNALRGRVY